jgi:hypothetical protein
MQIILWPEIRVLNFKKIRIKYTIARYYSHPHIKINTDRIFGERV